jgi:hypothetical protein
MTGRTIGAAAMAQACQKPFSLKGVRLNNRLDVINLRSVKVSFYAKI